MADALIRPGDIKGKVDFAVITIRPDEYKAVLERLPKRQSVVGGSWHYEYACVRNTHGEQIRIAVARTNGQGHGAAQQTANNIVADLNPKWIFLVGIAGGFPSDDFSLGDVLLASSLVDLSVYAAIQGGGTEYTVRGGPCHPDVESLLSWLPGQNHTLCEWNGTSQLIQRKPSLLVPNDADDERLYGDDSDYRAAVCKSLRHHFAKERPPLFTPATVATSNTLVKDTAIVEAFKKISRDVEHVEMEAGGVYRVCHQNHLPLLCIRGISDVVGFKRGPEWTEFACHTAASFFQCLVYGLSRESWGHSVSRQNRESRVVALVVGSLQLIANQLRLVWTATLSRKELVPRERITLACGGLLSQFEASVSGRQNLARVCPIVGMGEGRVVVINKRDDRVFKSGQA